MAAEKTVTHQQLIDMCSAIGVDAKRVDRVVITATEIEIQHVEVQDVEYEGRQPVRTTEVRKVRG